MIRRTLLVAGALVAPGVAHAQFDMGTKPIAKAVREGDEEKVRQFLLKGENPNQASGGAPLLVTAATAGHLAVVEALLKGGAIVDAADQEGYTALIRGAERGDVDIVELLLKRNAKPNAQTRQGVTALMVGARLGNSEIVRVLLDRKANPNTPDFTGRTALTYARQANRSTIEDMLRKAGGKE